MTNEFIKSLLVESIKDGTYFSTALNMCIAKCIADTMSAKNISKNDLAIKLNLSIEQIEYYLSGFSSFDTNFLGKLSIQLGIQFEVNIKNIDVSTDEAIWKYLSNE